MEDPGKGTKRPRFAGEGTYKASTFTENCIKG